MVELMHMLSHDATHNMIVDDGCTSTAGLISAIADDASGQFYIRIEDAFGDFHVSPEETFGNTADRSEDCPVDCEGVIYHTRLHTVREFMS